MPCEAGSACVVRHRNCRLAFGAVSYFDRMCEPAPHQVTSTAATDVSGQHGGAAFTTTHWSVVLEAQGESPAAQEALEKLCRTYWRPIFAFLRRQGLRPEEAEDITQGFFAELLERRSLEAVRKEKGRLRSFLLGGLKYFLANEGRRAMAIKRGKGQRLFGLDELRAEDRRNQPADLMSAEKIYERRWALTVLERVLSRLKDEYFAADNATLFDSLKGLLPDEPGSPSQAEIARRLGMTRMRFGKRFIDFGNATSRYYARRSPTQLRHPATSKTNYAISSSCSNRKDTKYTKARHELHELAPIRQDTDCTNCHEIYETSVRHSWCPNRRTFV